MDSYARRDDKEIIKRCKKIGKEIAGKTLSEKMDHVNSISRDSEKIAVNVDGKLTVTWSFNGNGKYKCICFATVNKGVKASELAFQHNNAGDCIVPL